MTHKHHPSLEGYHEDQILHDGCPECEARGKDYVKALYHMDAERFEKAWRRAADWQLRGLDNISNAESKVLNYLWAVQIQLEKRGIPLGHCPFDAVLISRSLHTICRSPGCMYYGRMAAKVCFDNNHNTTVIMEDQVGE